MAAADERNRGGTAMGSKGRMLGAALAVGLFLAGCGIDHEGTAPVDRDDTAAATTTDADQGAAIDGGDDPGTALDAATDAPVVVTVDGVTYTIADFMGGQCDTEGQPEQSRDLAVSGYATSGERIELSFTLRTAEFAPSGEDEFYGTLGVGSGAEGHWQVISMEPWPWLAGDRSVVSGSVTMEDDLGFMDDDRGTPVEVSFEISCP